MSVKSHQQVPARGQSLTGEGDEDREDERF